MMKKELDNYKSDLYNKTLIVENLSNVIKSLKVWIKSGYKKDEYTLALEKLLEAKRWIQA
jgi:hypothetical protein